MQRILRRDCPAEAGCGLDPAAGIARVSYLLSFLDGRIGCVATEPNSLSDIGESGALHSNNSGVPVAVHLTDICLAQ